MASSAVRRGSIAASAPLVGLERDPHARVERHREDRDHPHRHEQLQQREPAGAAWAEVGAAVGHGSRFAFTRAAGLGEGEGRRVTRIRGRPCGRPGDAQVELLEAGVGGRPAVQAPRRRRPTGSRASRGRSRRRGCRSATGRGDDFGELGFGQPGRLRAAAGGVPAPVASEMPCMTAGSTIAISISVASTSMSVNPRRRRRPPTLMSGVPTRRRIGRVRHGVTPWGRMRNSSVGDGQATIDLVAELVGERDRAGSVRPVGWNSTYWPSRLAASRRCWS